MAERNETRDFSKQHQSDVKLDKSKELNTTMTIKETERDEYTNKIHNLGGNG